MAQAYVQADCSLRMQSPLSGEAKETIWPLPVFVSQTELNCFVS